MTSREDHEKQVKSVRRHGRRCAVRIAGRGKKRAKITGRRK